MQPGATVRPPGDSQSNRGRLIPHSLHCQTAIAAADGIGCLTRSAAPSIDVASMGVAQRGHVGLLVSCREGIGLVRVMTSSLVGAHRVRLQLPRQLMQEWRDIFVPDRI